MNFRTEFSFYCLRNSICFCRNETEMNRQCQRAMEFFVFEKLTEKLGMGMAQKALMRSNMNLIRMLAQEYDKENNCIPESTMDKIYPEIIDYLI